MAIDYGRAFPLPRSRTAPAERRQTICYDNLQREILQWEIERNAHQVSPQHRLDEHIRTYFTTCRPVGQNVVLVLWDSPKGITLCYFKLSVSVVQFY
jgi:hypothetical protein